jgi:uncharacterized protein (TIGR02996 family)
MNPENAFQQAILSSPDDDTPRLVYADWLEEHGQPDRAAFIRIQCQLALLPDDDPRRAELETRERGLLEEHEEEWAGLLPRPVTRRWFQRGFLAGVEMPVRSFSRLGDVFEEVPTVRHLRLLGPFRFGKPPMAAIAASPDLARLTSLEIRGGYYAVGPDAVAVLAGSPHLDRLTSLSLHENAVGGASLAAIASSPHLCRLTTLSLLCYGFNAVDFVGLGVEALASPTCRMRLTTLRLPRCGIGDEGCRVLASATSLTGLHTLDLSSNQVGGRGAEALVAAPSLAHLTKLDLRRNRIPDPVRRQLRARFGEGGRF